MAVTTLKLAGREFVILPKSEFAALKARANGHGSKSKSVGKQAQQDLADLREIERLKGDPAQKPISWNEARKRLL